MERVIKFLKENLQNKTVVLGCSYGPDSMCLLNLLIDEEINTVCAHVNHNIRRESSKEAKALEYYCKQNKVVFEKKELGKKDLSEAYYRKIRINFFKEIADKYNTNIILTAHHADDLIETILMRITRGSNLSGYAGFKIKYTEDDYVYMKPLIYLSKDEILKYNSRRGIPYAIDKSNFTDKYTRNRYRLHVLPFLKEENSHVHKKFLDYSEELLSADRYLSTITKSEYNKIYEDGILDLKEFNKLDEYIKVRVLNMVFKTLYKDNIDKISKKHILKIIELIKKNSTFSYNLPKGWIVLKEYDKLIISQDLLSDDENYNVLLNNAFRYKEHNIYRIEKEVGKSNNVLRLNSKDVKLPLYVRCKKESDRIVVKNSDFYKKLKKVFIDKKVPKRFRCDYPVVVDSENTILWVPGVIKSKFDVDNNKKYDIILKYERKEKTNEEEK